MLQEIKMAQPLAAAEPVVKNDNSRQCDYNTGRIMMEDINHEAFIADVYSHLKEISKLVKMYGYQGFVYATFTADGYIHIDSYNSGLEYAEVPISDGSIYKKFQDNEEVVA